MQALKAVLFVSCITTTLALYGPKSDVILLNSKNFDKEVMNSNHVWLVEFFAPWCGHCKNLAPEWEKVAKKMKGIVKVAAVDADADRELGGRFGIKGFPTIKTFGSPVGSKSAGKKKTPMDYNGARSAKAIIDYAISLLPAKNVAKIDSLAALDKMDSNLPKALLFSEKATAPPLLTALSLEFHQKISFGFVKNSASEVATKFGVSSFPTVVFVPTEGEHTAYEGDLKADKLTKFFAKFVGSSKNQAAEDKPSAEDKPKPKPKPKAEEDTAPAEVTEITTNEQLNLYCEQKKHLCLLAFLDPLADKSSHEGYLSTLKAVAEKSKKHYSVVWIDSTKQPDFFAHFQPADLPCLRVWNKSKGAAANVVASLTTDSISKFLQDVLAGRARTAKIADPPALVDGGVALPDEEPLDDAPAAAHEEL